MAFDACKDKADVGRFFLDLSSGLVEQHRGGPAEKTGMWFGDCLTAIDVEQVGRPAKELIYLLGSLFPGFVLNFQSVKARKMKRECGSAAVEGTT